MQRFMLFSFKDYSDQTLKLHFDIKYFYDVRKRRFWQV